MSVQVGRSAGKDAVVDVDVDLDAHVYVHGDVILDEYVNFVDVIDAFDVNDGKDVEKDVRMGFIVHTDVNVDGNVDLNVFYICECQYEDASDVSSYWSLYLDVDDNVDMDVATNGDSCIGCSVSCT